MKRSLVAAFALTLLPTGLVGQSDPVEEAARTISQEDYAWRIGVIAHDSMQGRNTPSPGLDKTAEWIASEFRRFGLKGGVEGGGFLQRYPLVETVLDTDASRLQVRGGAAFRYGVDVIPVRSGSDAGATGGVVVLSGTPDLQALSGLSLDGKHVVLVLPAAAASNRRALFGTLAAIGGSGAASAILVNGGTDAEWASAVRQALRPSVSWPSEERGGGGSVPMVQVRPRVLEGILQGSGLAASSLQASGALKVTEVPGVTLTLTQRVRVGETSAPNVVGILEGSDPVLKDEYLVFSAHMDHVGMGTPDEKTRLAASASE